MGNNPSHFKGTNLPVENVSWNDCQPFLAELQNKTGRKFALPTEAQWEYACRASTTNLYSCGDDETNLAEHAWYASNSDLKTHPVGQKKPNAWGLYDMHGNVFEWCADWYSDSYPKGDATDPLGAASGERRVVRGGAWLYVSDDLRSAARSFSPPDDRVNEYGLRCVMLAGATPPSGVDAEARERKAKAAPILARLDTAVAGRNRFQAESILAQLEDLIPGDPRLTTLRNKVAALPWPKKNLVIALDGGVKMEFVLIRPGSFMMGSDKSHFPDERPAHKVTITKPFYLGIYEVTQKQWMTLLEENPSFFKKGPKFPKGQNHPVEDVSWALCRNFLEKLNAKVKGYEFRLPTEAEWEYACRAGTTNKYSFGDSAAALGDYAWYGANSGSQTHPVGGRKPNAWGLYDMYGNVWEWCNDNYGPYSGPAVSDPAGPGSSPGTGHVVRGGAWNSSPDHVSSTFRDTGPGSDDLMSYYGFRCAAASEPAQ
jgi:formylglycine-generating enzyme required for sulfatase activity